MQVRDVLKSKSGGAIVLGSRASVGDALALLVQHNIGSLPILDDRGTLAGIFTERDVLRGLHRDREGLLDREVGTAMTPDPIVCAPGDDLPDVMGKLTEHRVGQLPVVDRGEVVGLVSVGDLVKYLYEQATIENNHLIDYLYGPR